MGAHKRQQVCAALLEMRSGGPCQFSECSRCLRKPCQFGQSGAKRQNSSEFAPKSQIGGDVVRHRSMWGQSCPDIAGPKPTTLGRDSARSRSKVRPDFAQMRPTPGIDQNCPGSAKLGPMLAEFDQPWPGNGRVMARNPANLNWPTSTSSLAASTKFGPGTAQFGPGTAPFGAKSANFARNRPKHVFCEGGDTQ